MAENATRIGAIIYRLPRQDAETRALFAALATLLTPTEGVEQGDETLTLMPRYPVGALPRTAFTLADVPTPEVVFASEEAIPGTIAVLHLASMIQNDGAAHPARTSPPGLAPPGQARQG